MMESFLVFVNQVGNMMTDPIADMLTRIRNAVMARKSTVEIPFSKVKLEIAKILRDEGYIGALEERDGMPRILLVNLKYHGKQPALQVIKRESTPGHRVYQKATDIPRILNDYGIAIVSTSKGIMTNKQARELGVGGEILCSVY
jgi:small subunit ribosomal protein S8